MADDAVQKQEDDQNLWRATYTTAKGWTAGVAFADHLSIAAPALAQVNGTLYCAHRGARQGEKRLLPVRWTSFDPASTRPFITALDEAAKPLPEEATEAETAQWRERLEAAADALDAARKWTPDTTARTWEDTSPVIHSMIYRQKAEDVVSVEPPALADDHGTLRMVFTVDSDGGPQIHESHLITDRGAPCWENPEPVSDSYDYGMRPALAMFNDELHLLYVSPGYDGDTLVHLVRREERWEQPESPQGNGVQPPHYEAASAWDGGSSSANLALAAHNGKLHLVYPGREGELTHCVFDGASWSEPASLGETNRSRRNAALASYDGKLHAVYPPAEGDALRHAIWSEADGWDKGVDLAGHDSNNTPALLVAKDGPEGQPREALLLVHRGIDRYVPPPPRTPENVTDLGETVYGPWKSDEGWGGWSRLRHRTSITPGLHNGQEVLVLSWEAKAEYYWGFWYYPDHGGYPQPASVGAVHLRLRDSKGAAPDGRAFTFTPGTPDGSGNLRFDTVIDRPEPGTYTLSHLYGTEKTGGYYWTTGSHAGHDNDDYHRWCRLTLESKSKATITLT